MRTVVIGFDGSPAAERALERAAALSAVRVIVVTAGASVPATSVVDGPVLERPSPAERAALLERAAARLRDRGIDPELIAAEDSPAEALLAAARAHDAALIVVGSVGSDYAARVIIGSTAESVVRHAPCDVLVVR
jgi:nucleotide-binding universal stress UspA family protein